jgi:hypothetical protein
MNRTTEIAANPASATLPEIAALAREVTRLREALTELVECVVVPERNCSCHISLPCSDCELFGALRLAKEQASVALATPAAPPVEKTCEAEPMCIKQSSIYLCLDMSKVACGCKKCREERGK